MVKELHDKFSSDQLKLLMNTKCESQELLLNSLYPMPSRDKLK